MSTKRQPRTPEEILAIRRESSRGMSSAEIGAGLERNRLERLSREGRSKEPLKAILASEQQPHEATGDA